MNLEITEELQSYLNAYGKVVLNACPGSGKTTAIAKKIIELEDKYLKKYGKFSGIACLSFTNAAKDELNLKFNELSGRTFKYPNLVSTIDSFINLFITLPYYYLLDRNFARPKILENNSRLDSFFKIKYKNKQGKLVDGLTYKVNNFKARDNRSIYFLYAPSKIRLEPDGSYSINGNQPSEDKVDLKKFNDYCTYIKKWQFEKGLITTNDSAFIAFKLLKKFPQISKWLTLRFPHIIIDEAQDNSLLQHKIFEELGNNGLINIEFIGDPYQSLYEFRDANPQLFLDKYKSKDYNGLDLTNNRRSPQHIIDCFSLMRPKKEQKIKTACDENLKEPILVYRYKTDNRSKVINHYDNYCITKGFQKKKIVVRGNTVKNKMLGRDALQQPWHNQLAYDLIKAKIEYNDKNLKEAINIVRHIVVDLENPKIHYSDRVTLVSELASDYANNAKLIKLIKDLPSLSNTVKDWSEMCPFYLKKSLELHENIDFGLKKVSKYLLKSTLSEPVSDHFNRVDINKIGSLTTVHQVKGKTLDAILVFFDEKNHPNNINFRDLEPDTDGFISEKKRIIYVAMSRPKHLLALAFPDKITEDQIKTKLGNKILIIPEEDLKKITEQ